MADDFIHLRCHSDMSLLTGAAKLQQYFEAAKERGNPALAFTEDATLRGISDQHNLAKHYGVRALFGVECYVCGDMRRKGLSADDKAIITSGLPPSEWRQAIEDYEREHGINQLHQVTVWVRNDAGFRSLFRLTSRSWVEGFYYKPRIDIDELIKLKEGLMIGTHGPNGLIHARALIGQRRRALEIADRLWEEFGPENMWFELQPHPILAHAQANQFTLDLLKRYGKEAQPLAVQNAHYIGKEDYVYQRMLAAIGSRNKGNPMDSGLPGECFYFKTAAEMRESFASHHNYLPAKLVKRAMANTQAFNERVTATLKQDKFSFVMPDAEVPDEYDGDEFKYMVALCKQGWEWRGIPERAREYARVHDMSEDDALEVYTARLRKELGALKRQNFVTYILLVRELYAWVRSQKIAVGPGRGSAGGSIVNYLLGITSVDPVEHNLLFERFISPTRIDMPDIDMDFEDARRHEIIEHLKDKYGHDKVCQIATIGKLKGKACIRDVSRMFDIPMGEVNPVTKSIIERSSGDERASMTIVDSFEQFEVCRRFNDKYPEVLQYTQNLEGMARTLGIHAAGVVTSPVPLEDIIPLETRNHHGERVVVTGVDFWSVQSFGLLKLDCLGLKTMTVLRIAREMVDERKAIDVEYEELELSDKTTLDGFTRHDYGSVFQFDTPSMDKVSQGVEYQTFEDVATLNALNRPGTSRSGLAQQWIDRKKNPELVKESTFHPAISRITADSLGIIVYQEHVIRIFIEIAGFHPGSADRLRKDIAKSTGEEKLGKERENFIKGAMEHTPGMTEEIAGRIMDAITFFGSYGFNKSHATEYGMIGYWCMYMKQHHPLEFLTAALRCEKDSDKIQKIIKDVKAHDIEVLPPDVNTSKDVFSIDGGAIRGSLVDIKGVGEKAASSIMRHQPYEDFIDFIQRVDRRSVHKGVVQALAISGALDSLLPNPRWFLENLELLWKPLGKKDSDGNIPLETRERLRKIIKLSKHKPQFSEEERVLEAAKVSPLAFGRHPIDAYSEFVEANIAVPIADLSMEDFYVKMDLSRVGGCFVLGIITEIKLNQVGDFHNGPEPDEATKKRMNWGARYANVNIEDANGTNVRVKFDWDVFADYWTLLESGRGNPLLIHVSVNKQYENMRAHFAVDLVRYKSKLDKGEPLGFWENVIRGDHPATLYEWESPGRAKLARRDLRIILNDARKAAKGGRRARFKAIGVVTHVKQKRDKNGNLMGFFGLLGAEGYIDCLAFASSWVKDVRKAIKPGHLLEVELEYNRGSAIYGGGKIRWMKKNPLTLPETSRE